MLKQNTLPPQNDIAPSEASAATPFKVRRTTWLLLISELECLSEKRYCTLDSIVLLNRATFIFASFRTDKSISAYLQQKRTGPTRNKTELRFHVNTVL